MSLELTFGEWMKLMRSKQKESQARLAEKLGVCTNTVVKWEQGKTIPNLTPDQTFTLCQVLGVSLESLAIAFRGEATTK